MAVIDPVTDAVVIRVVYDGAPFAGKTTSVRALGSGLGSAVTSPGEIAGRTLFFDWLDYTGGLFEGRRIRCQIVSVPGQAVLAPRRRRLLESADVVVYVLDSSAAAFSSERGYLEGLKATLGRLGGPPVGVIVQANKRDLEDAIPIPELRQTLDSVGLTAAVVETNAATGSGIRESFVLAVRLALDRIRELVRTGQLRTETPDINDHQALLDDLQSHDHALAALNDLTELPHTRLSDLAAHSRATVTPPVHVNESSAQFNAGAGGQEERQTVPLAAQALMQALADNDAAAQRSETIVPQAKSGDTTVATIPLAPDDRVASGLIWPVVVGRTILNEITGLPWQPQQLADGAWIGDSGDRWRLISGAADVVNDLDHGRGALVHWARMHVAATAILSPDRCIVLSDDHAGRLRLWQVFRRTFSLADMLAQGASGDAQHFAAALLACCMALGDIHSRLEIIDFPLDVNLQALSIREHRVVFSGIMPVPAGMMGGSTAPDVLTALDALIDREFAHVLDSLEARRCELTAFLEQSTASMRQALDAHPEIPVALADYIRNASPDRMDQAVLQLTALMVAV